MQYIADPTEPARDRIVAAAAHLFYARGIGAVSADTIIGLAGIAKATFYRHFPTKEALVVAYLERQLSREREEFEHLRRTAGGEAETLRLMARKISAECSRPDFHGCHFINAAAEHPDADSPVRKVVADRRRWYRGALAELLDGLGVSEPEEVADEIGMLRDGAMTACHLDGSGRVGQALAASIDAVVSTPRPGRSGVDAA